MSKAIIVSVLAFVLAPQTDSIVVARSQQTALRILVLKGEDAVNIIQQKTAVAPVVEVRDRNDLPVAGAMVVFTIDGSVASFAGSQTLTVVTNAAGQATAAGLTPTAAGAFKISATATFQAQTAAVTITQSTVLDSRRSHASEHRWRSSGGGSAGKVIAIAGGIGAAGAGAAVALGKSDSSDTQQPGATTATTTTPPTATPPPPPNNAPVINAASATPTVGLVAVTSTTLDVQASDPDNDQLTYFWEFPDGTTSDQRSFSRIFQLGGTHNIRITVRDATTSTSRELSFEMKTLTGRWDQLNTGPAVIFLSVEQHGSSLSGTMSVVGPQGFTCPLTGSLRPSPPHVILDISCRNSLSIGSAPPLQITTQYRVELQLDADFSAWSGTSTRTETVQDITGIKGPFTSTSQIAFRKRD